MKDNNCVYCMEGELVAKFGIKISVFHPDKINYGAYDDTGRHLHFHLVPKYKDGFE